VQKVLLDNRDTKQALDEAAAEVDRASADFRNWTAWTKSLTEIDRATGEFKQA
jgi:hypothetical protein